METADTSNLLRTEAELILTQTRKEKAERTKDQGSPLQLVGKALDLHIDGGHAWIAENTTVAKKIDLETGKVLQIYRGHTGPVTSLALYNNILITGSWDKTIKLWNTDTKALISSTPAHSDFVKCLLVLPSLNLLVSAGSDKIVRIWDLSTASEPKPLTAVDSISGHTRPVEHIDGIALSNVSATLYTADTMGVIKVWDLVEDGPTYWRHTLLSTLAHHRTGINRIWYKSGQIWTGSSDGTVQVVSHPPTAAMKPLPPIIHPVAVRCILPLALTDLAEPYLLTGAGDVIRVYDISTLEEPELIVEVDAHWHDVTALKLWMRTFVGEDGRRRIEPWVVSTSLDGTLRKWRVTELLKPKSAAPVPVLGVKSVLTPKRGQFEMSEEEERELAELLEED